MENKLDTINGNWQIWYKFKNYKKLFLLIELLLIKE